MKIETVTELVGSVHEFHARSIWQELIKAGASFTVDIDAGSSVLPNKVVHAYTPKVTKPDLADAERFMLWIRNWAKTHYNSELIIRVYTPLSSAVMKKLSNMVVGTDVSTKFRTSHVSITNTNNK